MKKGLFILSIMSLLISCSKNVENAKISVSEEDFYGMVKIKNPFLAMSRAEIEEVEQGVDEDENKDYYLGIFKFRIAKPSTDCKRGWGICDFKLFPKRPDRNEVALSSREYAAKIYSVNGTNGLRVNILLDKPLPEDVDALALEVENDIYWIKDSVTLAEIQEYIDEIPAEELEGDGILSNPVIKLESGSIPFNPALGDFGGYQICLKDSI